jgi:hypothetical protein
MTRLSLLLAASTLLTAVCARPASAEILFVDLYRDQSWEQTGDGASLTSLGAFFSARLYSSVPSEYDTVTMTYPGIGSPVGLTEDAPPSTTYIYQTAFLSKATMDSDYPAGTYAFDATNGGGTDAASVEYSFSDDNYPATTPFLTGTDFSDLQGMNASNPFTFHFSPYEPGSSFDEALLFFSVYDYDLGAFVFQEGLLPPTTTELTVPGGTLTAGHFFSYELVYSNRTLIDSPDTTFPSTAGFDLRTRGNFSAVGSPVPEPASMLMLVQGLVLGGWIVKRRRARSG